MSKIKIEVIDNNADFDALEPAWRALEAQSLTHSIFRIWDWQRSWWQHYGYLGELRVLLAWDNDNLVGILPLYIQRQGLKRILRNIGTGGDTSPDYLDPLLAPHRSDDIAEALAGFAISGVSGWNLLNVSDISLGSTFARMLEQNCRAHCVLLETGEPMYITHGQLPSSWEGYLAQLSQNRRSILRRTRRRIDAMPEAVIEAVQRGPELDAILDRLAILHIRRWKGRAAHFAFSSPRYIAFHRDIIRRFSAEDRLRFHVLRIGGEIAGVYYGYRYRNRSYAFQSGFEPSLASLSPGVALIAHAIEHAIQEGCSDFDMLRGDYDHKKRWFSAYRTTVTTQACRRGMLAAGIWLRRLFCLTVAQDVCLNLADLLGLGIV